MDASTVRDLWQRLPPDPEAVTFSARAGDDGDGPATFSSYTLSAKGMRPKARQVAVGGSLVVRRTRHWQMWLPLMEQAAAVAPASLPCPSPNPGDRITDADGGVWNIDSVDERIFGVCWLCEATKEN